MQESPSQQEAAPVPQNTNSAADEQSLQNPWVKLFSTEKLLSMGIITTRCGFVLILLLCIMMEGQHFNHFVVLFFLTFGLNCSLIYYKGLLQKSKETPTEAKQE